MSHTLIQKYFYDVKKIILYISNNSVYKFVILIICAIIYHAMFFSYNTILTEADSYAYIRMAEGLMRFSSDGLGNGWFGFMYSAFLAVFLPFFQSDIFAGQVANMLLLTLSAFLFYRICIKILSSNWSFFALILFLFHPSFVYYRIHLLAENIYIPIFFAIILIIWNFIEDLKRYKQEMKSNILLREDNFVKPPSYIRYSCLLGIFLGFLYLTRAEGFIYIGSIGFIAIYLLYKRYMSFKYFIVSSSVFFISFFICISPYLIHLHSLTGEWGLTNKGSSNWRQAELRGRNYMDDLGFEEAVAGLTEDKTSLIAGFAGGMQYFRPQIEGSFIDSFIENPTPHIKRIFENQAKLFSQNIPEIYYGNSYILVRSDDARFHSLFFRFFLLLLIIPFIVGIIIAYNRYSQFFGIFFSFFIFASVFFTLFFTLNRYFIIFLPLFLICTTIGIHFLSSKIDKNTFLPFYIIPIIFFIFFLLNTTLSQYNYLRFEYKKNNFYALKQEAGEWILQNSSLDKDVKVLERFPFVTYYSGAKWRYITPYTEDIQDIRIYMLHHDIDFLIVDSMDFYIYRPALRKYLYETPSGFKRVQTFTNNLDQVIHILQAHNF